MGKIKNMNSEITKKIQSELDSLEKSKKITILYACESGSRAWGFESKDSDYDVRFIYICSTKHYLSIYNKKDVVEKPIDGELDISGWDIVKALHLFRKSNPPLLEWLQSPIIYREKGGFISKMKNLMPDYYSPISCMYHYLHMAQGNYREYLHGEEVRIKKYLYVLRPVLGCIWIERGLGVVSTEFQVLVDKLIEDKDLRRAIDVLLENKKQGKELDYGIKIPEISKFLDEHIKRLTGEHQRPALSKNTKTLEQLFHETLIEINGPNIL